MAEPSIINPSPKTRFQSARSNVESHRSLMQRDDLQRSIDAALLEYQAQVCLRTNEQMAGAGHLRMLGVHEFLQVLRHLGESYSGPRATDSPINHKA